MIKEISIQNFKLHKETVIRATPEEAKGTVLILQWIYEVLL